MTNIYKSSVALAISLALTACGGGGSEPTPKEPVNVAPQLSTLETQSIKEGKSLTITASATDSDGSISNYAWTQTDGASVELSNANTASVMFTTPALDADTSITLKVTATDNDGATTTSNVTVDLLNNRLPTIESISAQSFNENGEFNIDAVVDDEDGEIASIRWEQTSGKSVTLIDSDKATVSINTPKIGQGEVGQLRLIATDDDGEEVEQFVDFDLMNTHHNITLSGNTNLNGTALANSEIAFEINGQVFNSTADVNGDYSIELDVELSNENYAYQLKASGVDSQSNVNLSRTALFNEILLASQNTEVQAQSAKSKTLMSVSSSSKTNDNNGVSTASADIDALTTSESEYLASLFGEEDFINTEYTDSNEFKKKYKNIDAALLLEIATALSYAAQNNEQVQTDNGLVSITDFLAGIYADEEGKALFEQLLSEQKSNNKNEAADFFVNGDVFYSTLASTQTTIRKGVGSNQSFYFDENGDYSLTNIDSTRTGPWSKVGQALLVDTSDWSAKIENHVWIKEADVHATCFEYTKSKKYEVISGRFEGVKQAIDTTEIEGECLSEVDESQVREFSHSQELYFTAYSDDDLEAWENKDLDNTSIVFEHYSDTAKVELNNLDGETRSMEYQFSPNGTGKVIEDNNAAFAWEIDDAGILTMKFDAGYTISWLKMYDDRSDKKGGASVFAMYKNGEQSYQYQDMAVTVNKPEWGISDFVGKWDHGFSVSQPKYNVFMDGFFFEINEDGTGSKNNTSADGVTVNWSAPIHWFEEDGKLILVRTFIWGEDGWEGFSDCNYKTDDNCYIAEHRTWEVLLKHGQRFYVKETLGFDNDLWDIGTPTTDPSRFHVTERTNFYQPFNKGN